jgi:hypothetical protein
MSENRQIEKLDFEQLAFRYSVRNRDLLLQALEATINRFCCEFSFSHAEVVGILEIIKQEHLASLAEQRRRAL